MSFNYYFQIPLIILITFIVTKIIKFTLYYAFRFWNKRNSIFITSIIISIKKPIIYFLWFYSILISINILLSRFYKKFNYNSTSNIVVFVIYTTILVILIRNISQIKKKYLLRKLRKNNNVDIVGIDTMEKVIKITTIVLWIFSILNQFGVQLSALLTFGGIGGIAIGLAGKDLFANIFGGLIIYLDKPFSVGDYIISDTNSIKGIVEYIGWRQTKVVTASNNIPQYIPNSILAITTIQNRSRVKFHKFNEIITIMYKDFNKAEEVMKDITNLLKQNKHINKRNLPSVLLEDLRKNLSIQIIMTTNTSDYLKFLMIRQNILLDIFKLMGEKKIEIVAPDNYVKLENITN